MKFGFKTLTAATAFIAMSALGSAQAGVIVIDDFTLGGSVIAAASSTSFAHTDDGTGTSIIGGQRQTRVRNTSAASSSTNSYNVTISTFSGLLSWANDPGVVADLTLQWLGNLGAIDNFQTNIPACIAAETCGFGHDNGAGGDSSGGFSVVDFTDGGTNTGLAVDIIAADGNTLEAYFEFWDAAGNSASHALVKDNVNATNRPFHHLAAFDTDFAFTGAFDFENVVGVQMTVSMIAPFDGVDLALDFVDTRDIPEPTTIALFGAGLVALGAVRRRRKMAA